MDSNGKAALKTMGGLLPDRSSLSMPLTEYLFIAQ
jgi:hypothetical protein